MELRARVQLSLIPQKHDIINFMNTNQKTNDDNVPVEIIGLDELEKEEPEDSTVNTSDYGDDVDDTTPAEAEETIEKADEIIAEDEKEHPGF